MGFSIRLLKDGQWQVNYHRVSPVTVTAVRNERAPFYWGCTADAWCCYRSSRSDDTNRGCNNNSKNSLPSELHHADVSVLGSIVCHTGLSSRCR